MATPREIKKRINSVKNTRKITRTMEMVSTAKAKKATNKVNAAKPYADLTRELVSSLSSLAGIIHSPYLRKPDKIRKVAILAIAANRGLCGGFNSNLLRMVKNRIEELKSKGVEVEVHAAGKKAISFFKFAKVELVTSYTNIDDKAGSKEANDLASYFMERFANESVDSVEIISTHYYSAANQKPEITSVLPLQMEESGTKGSSGPEVLYEPDPKTILENLLPMVIKTTFVKIILESVASEHIARRVAMKAATDAAGEMIKLLTRGYNRVRQAKITQEISEIVGGAEAIS
ncbi:ATP synthase F1 subunit gamma [Leptospira levettii]|uniref:ATP synthase F1 subunit gamma n=1 Tax=Leptospira levettii TaxID=2023178 RepID=UPI000C2AF816|nr:ATP synthase F1 subunit gamma [Leptospira levettii]MCG6148039.1 ATP synthase F1 subunit gamma [Leptospira levettii]PKA21956.1 ATP synthase F1 subunit gamma [Leptospira sp. mixed culture ATI2-C-A1]TGM69939.1 ATP synthase F1 subunit gamma [Leptospira levettii]TGM83770.1 ATP synthase F1 subunit gamma [Leptospira levettii]